MANLSAWQDGRAVLRGLALWLGCTLWPALPARAEAVPDLYAVSVPVAEQAQGELQRAAAAGVRELAVRISGRSSAASDPALAALFANAMRYVDQYRFERNAGAGAPWLAQLRFAPAQIDAELRRAGLPVWGGNRPALQTVVVVEDGGAHPEGSKRAVIDDNSPLAEVLQKQWRHRGLVPHLPRSAGNVNADDVLQLDAAKVMASTGARVDGIVLGRVVLAPDGACQSRWVLQPGGVNAQSFTAEATGSELARCVASALDRIVDNLSAQYAVAANSSVEGIVLRVTGIASFEDYQALLNYLRRLAIIKNAQPVVVRGDEIFVQLKAVVDAEQLARQLALESRLTATENSVNTLPGANAPLPVALSYQWAAVRN